MKKALFLDRDGVINIDYGYVGKIDQLTFNPNIFDLCISAQQYGYKIIVITNQAGIAKNKFSLEDFIVLTKYMIKCFNNNNINVVFYFCPYHDEAQKKEFLINKEIQKEIYPSKVTQILSENIYLSDYRKPSPGMILQASKQFNINLTDSIFIGDQDTDILAANLAKIGYSILIDENNKSSQISCKPSLIMKKIPKNFNTIFMNL